MRGWLAENNIKVMRWPPYSPDLNPIEQVWKRLKEQKRTHPGLAGMPGGPEKVKARSVEILSEIWESAECSFLQEIGGEHATTS